MMLSAMLAMVIGLRIERVSLFLVSRTRELICCWAAGSRDAFALDR